THRFLPAAWSTLKSTCAGSAGEAARMWTDDLQTRSTLAVEPLPMDRLGSVPGRLAAGPGSGRATAVLDQVVPVDHSDRRVGSTVKVHVVVGEVNRLYLDAMVNALNSLQDLDVVGAVSDAAEVLGGIRRSVPGVVVLGWGTAADD